jgi:hypothetical protein
MDKVQYFALVDVMLDLSTIDCKVVISADNYPCLSVSSAMPAPSRVHVGVTSGTVR